jgi:hypothetical protein
MPPTLERIAKPVTLWKRLLRGPQLAAGFGQYGTVGTVTAGLLTGLG